MVLAVVNANHSQVRNRARTALLRYTQGALADLRSGAGDALRGVDWSAVARFVNLERTLDR